MSKMDEYMDVICSEHLSMLELASLKHNGSFKLHSPNSKYIAVILRVLKKNLKKTFLLAFFI
jgi:hypothetical protein